MTIGEFTSVGVKHWKPTALGFSISALAIFEVAQKLGINHWGELISFKNASAIALSLLPGLIGWLMKEGQ